MPARDFLCTTGMLRVEKVEHISSCFFFAILCRVKLLEPIQSCSRELS